MWLAAPEFGFSRERWNALNALSHDTWRNIAIASALAAAVLALFGQAVTFGFINYDDPLFVANNDMVQRGLTWDGLRYAFTTFDDGNYIPFTWLTHLLVAEFAGTAPGWHHLVSVLLHAACAAALYGVLLRATGYRGRSAAVAFLFALHPLRIESVVWVAERKDVLAALFWILAMLAYDGYVRRRSIGSYLLVLAAFLASLLSKPMAVTFPFALLLLDVWPYRRIRFMRHASRGEPVRRIVLEKVPMLALAAVLAAVTVYGQRAAGSLQTSATFPMPNRILNALASYAIYLAQTFWPVNLTVFYPRMSTPDLYIWAAAGVLLLVAVTAIAVAAFKRHPYVLIGWLWFVGTLVPVIGLVQVGAQSHADRYTYIPHIGLFVMLVWPLAKALAATPRRRIARAAIAAAAVAACAALTWIQIGYWRNSETLFARAIEVTDNNRLAHSALGQALYEQGLLDEAETHYRRALEINPRYALDFHNLGLLLINRGRSGEAVPFLERGVALDPESAGTWYLLGNALAATDRYEDAVDAYRRGLEIEPEQADARVDLGAALAMLGRDTAAEAEYRRALESNPDLSAAHYNLALVLMKTGRPEEACGQFEQAVADDPGNATALFHLAPCRYAAGDVAGAIDAYTRAIERDPTLAEAAQTDPRFTPLRRDPRFREVQR